MSVARQFLPAVVAAVLVGGCANGQNPHFHADIAPADTLRILTYNIHHGEGMDEVIEMDRIADLISNLDPDLVALQEVDRVLERTNRVDQAAVLGEFTGLTPVHGAFMDYQGGEYGMAILSRWPIVESINHRLPEGAEPRTALSARVRSPETGRELVFIGIHFYRTSEERMAQAATVVDAVRDEDVPVILAGDFNSQPDSEVILLLSQTWDVIEKGAAHFTFPSYHAEREIDFIMLRPGGSFDVLERDVLDESIISDHRPVYAEIVWN